MVQTMGASGGSSWSVTGSSVESGVRSRVKAVAMKIGQVARDAGVTVDTVRFYERRGVLPVPEREISGYRRYAEDAADRIRLAKSLQALGFTLSEVVDSLAGLDK